MAEYRIIGRRKANAQDQGPSFSQKAIGAGETALMMASGMVAEPVAGLVGLATAPFQGIDQSVRNIGATRNLLTIEPKTATGKQYVQNLAQSLAPIAEPISEASKALGEAGYQAGGPILGAAGETAIPAALELAGLGGIRSIRRAANAPIPSEAESIIRAGERANVPVRTTDVLPPQNFSSRWAQSIYEKIPFIGGASQRQSQQLARQEAVRGLADEYGLELDSIGDLSQNIVNSISRQTAQTLANAGSQRLRALQALDPAGEVPLNTTMQTIDRLLAQQADLGARADTGLVRSLTDIKDSLINFDPQQQRQMGRNFSGVKDIRTTVIDDLKAINRSDDPRNFGALQQVKSAMDRDMVDFARNTNPQAASDWLLSNRVFARELEATRRTELRRAFNSGNTTPEVVLPILRGGRRSELQRLNATLTPDGRRSARSAIVYDALAESGYFTDPLNANPDRLANAFNRQNRMQALDVFFSGQDKEALQGFIRLLDATKRAQQAGVVTPTGQQLVPFAMGGAALSEPMMTAIATATLSGFGRFYESAGMRNFLLRLNNTKAGSPQETSMIEAAVPAITASMKTLIESQQNQEE